MPLVQKQEFCIPEHFNLLPFGAFLYVATLRNTEMIGDEPNDRGQTEGVKIGNGYSPD